MLQHNLALQAKTAATAVCQSSLRFSKFISTFKLSGLDCRFA
jgi:hypothetical protein